MNAALTRWNRLPRKEAENEILPCCGSNVWAAQVAIRRPLANEAALLALSDEIWCRSDGQPTFYPQQHIVKPTRSMGSTALMKIQ